MATIEVPEDVLEGVVRVAHAATPQAAVVQALREFAERRDPSKLIPLLGTAEDTRSGEQRERSRRKEFSTTTAPASGLPAVTAPRQDRKISAEAAAAVRAAEEFAQRHDQSVLIPLLGTFDDMLSPEEFDRLREAE